MKAGIFGLLHLRFFFLALFFLFVADIFLVRFSRIIIKKKKYLGWFISFVLILGVNLWFYGMADAKLKAEARCRSEDVLVREPSPHHRVYPFIHNHTLVQDKRKNIYAIDEDGFCLTLRKAHPKQVYQDSFSIMMGKENFRIENKEDAINYAKFIILLYYGESEPVYISSKDDLIKYLRRSKVSNKVIEDVFHKKVVTKISSVYPPRGNDWDGDGKVYSVDDPNISKVLSTIHPPLVDIDWDGGYLFCLYTYSIRYKEIVCWYFKVFKDGRVWIKKMWQINLSHIK